jgi:DNA-binding NtrC family response regulator
MSGSLQGFPQAIAGQPVLSAPSVLCVQPQEDAQAFVSGAFAGYRVTIVANAYEAVRAINRTSFDAYVLEYWLPDWAGAPLCREIHKDDPHVPAIFYTVAGSELKARALRAGAMAYVQAPGSAAALREQVRMLLQAADVNSVRAMIELERHIANELRRRVAVLGSAAPARSVRDAAEARAKTKAAKVFIDAGGTRSYFERSWARQFSAVCAREGLQSWSLSAR